MQVASVMTDEPTLRSEIEGWTYEDSELLVRKSRPDDASSKLFIGYTPSPKNIPQYGCVLEMLADGWELLGPPVEEGDLNKETNEIRTWWGWWLQRKQQVRRPA